MATPAGRQALLGAVRYELQIVKCRAPGVVSWEATTKSICCSCIRHTTASPAHIWTLGTLFNCTTRPNTTAGVFKCLSRERDWIVETLFHLMISFKVVSGGLYMSVCVTFRHVKMKPVTDFGYVSAVFSLVFLLCTSCSVPPFRLPSWLNPHSMFISCLHISPVLKRLFGVEPLWFSPQVASLGTSPSRYCSTDIRLCVFSGL